MIHYRLASLLALMLLLNAGLSLADNGETIWEAFLANPSKATYEVCRAVVEDSLYGPYEKNIYAYTIRSPTEKDFVSDSDVSYRFRLLVRQANPYAVDLAFQLLSWTDGAVTEDSYVALGMVIGQNARLFLQMLKKYKPHDYSLGWNFGEELWGDAYGSRLERQKRIDALKAVTDTDLLTLRDKVLKYYQDDVAAYNKETDKLIEQFNETPSPQRDALVLDAVWSGRLEAARLFVDKGANVNVRREPVEVYKIAGGDTPLMMACKQTHTEQMISFLIEKGADVNAKDNDGKTPLMFASEGARVTAVNLLLSKGARVNEKDNEGRSALLFATYAWNDGKEDPEIADTLLKHGADVNAQDNDGVTPLIRAVWNARPGIVKVLLANGADVNARDKHGWTALRFAGGDSRKEIYDLLKQAGARK